MLAQRFQKLSAAHACGRMVSFCVMCLQVAEADYGQLVDRENINREEAGVDASGLEAAVAALVVGDSSPEDKHPEKYVSGSAAFLHPSVVTAWTVHWEMAETGSSRVYLPVQLLKCAVGSERFHSALREW